MRTRVLLATFAAAMVAAVPATASADVGNGNNTAAQTCQKDGYQNLGFTNAGGCTSTAAQGAPSGRTACASSGGTYGSGEGPFLAALGTSATKWHCTWTPGYYYWDYATDDTYFACAADGGFGSFVYDPANWQIVRELDCLR